MAYGHKIKKRDGKKTHIKTRKMKSGRLLASLAVTAGLLSHSFGIGEAEIVRKDGVSAAKIELKDNVYQISPEGTKDGFSYNRFKEFNLTSGQIANLLFGDNATALANLVNGKISIDGIVNGIKNEKIDGHLIFLSPDGIAVGQSGVINAGRFTGIVPTRTAFDALYDSKNPDTDITLANINELNSYEAGKTIDVSGHINTSGGIMLGAGVINIKDGAVLQSTKDVQFTDVVNTGMNPEISFVAGEGGDIILTAKQESAVKDTKPVLKADGTPNKDASGNEKTEKNSIRWRDRSTDLSAAINIGKNVKIINSDKAVKLTAESTSTYEDGTPMTLTSILKSVILGDEKTVVDGLVDKLAGKEAGANKFLFVNYSGKKNKASVNIGENSSITGNNIEVAATSAVEINQSVAVPAGESKQDSEGNVKTNNSAMPIAAVAISRVYNTADIVIDGNLKATGADENGSGIKIAADANTKAALSATAGGGEKTVAAVGVAVLSGDTKSKVAVNDKANATALTAENGKVSVEAVTKSDIDVKVNAVGKTSYVVSNVGVVNYDTNADVVMDRSVTAGAVDIKADNNFTKLKMTVDNTPAQPESDGNNGKDTQESTNEEKTQDDTDATADKNKPDTEKSEDEKKSEQKSVNPAKVLENSSADTANDEKAKDAAGSNGKGGVQDVKDKVEGTNAGGDNPNKISAFGLGTAVGVFSNKNDANVTIGKNAAINASTPAEAGENGPDGSVNVAANSLMTASGEDEKSLQFSVKNAQANAKVQIGAAVLVSNVKNNAKILLDNEGDKSAQIQGSGAADIKAAAGMATYKAAQKKIDDDGKETNETEEVDKDSLLSYAVNAEGEANEEKPATVTLDGSVGINTLKNNASVILGQKSKVKGSAVTLSSDTTVNAEGSYGAADTNSKVAVGATVGLQNIGNNSLIMAGKSVELTGAESVKATANNSLGTKNEVKNAGKGDSLGVSGMVALSYGDSNSIVSLDDETAITAPDAVSIEADNTTNVTNAAHGDFESSPGAKAFGIGVGIINYDVNSIAMVGDNGNGITAPSGNKTDAEKAAQKIYNDAKLAQKIVGDNAKKLGEKTADNAKGSIITGDLSVSSSVMGFIKNDAKAKAVTAEKEDDNDSDDNTADDSEKWTKWTQQGEEGANQAGQNTNALENDTQESQNESAAPTIGGTEQTNNASGAGREASSEANPDATPTDGGAAPAANESASASIGIEGSAALTFLGGRTDSVLDNVTVKSTQEDPGFLDSVSVDVSATDFLGAITLGGTTTKHSLKTDGGPATKVGIGGTFAMNGVNRDVDSLVRNSTLEKVGYLSNDATKIGLEVAAGMGLSTTKGDGVNVNGAGVVYYNRAKHDVHALLINNKVTSDFLSDVLGNVTDNLLGLGMLSNEVTDTDFQIAGGLAATSGSGNSVNVGVGGAVAISNLTNDLASGIIGGSYENFSSIDVTAQKSTTQINGAVAGGKTGYGFNGAFAYGSAKNKTHAYIAGDADVGGVLTGKVNVTAGEVPVIKPEDTLNKEKTDIDNKKTAVDNKEKLTDKSKTRLKNSLEDDKKKTEDNATQTKTNKTSLENTGIDTTGKVYLLEGNETSSLSEDDTKDADGNKTEEGKIADEAASDENDAKGLLGQNYGITITAAMAGGLLSGEGSVAGDAGIAYNYVKNDIAADIKNSKITADSVTGEASSDSLIVSVGAGVAVGGKAFNGAGSGSWNDLKNDTKVTFADNTIETNKITEKADNSSSIINIAGEVAGGKGMAMGLSLAYNSLNNTTGTYLTGNDIDMEKDLIQMLSGGENSVKLATSNTGKTITVAGGIDVNISQEITGAVGTVAINRGVSNTESFIDGKTTGEKSTLDDVKNLSVTADELTKRTTVAGGISVGGKKVGVGGAVAYSAVGSSGNKEKLLAEVNHADITTDEKGTIEVSVNDSKTNDENELERSRTTTVGAGFGVSWGKNFFNLQGAAAVSDIYKDSRAALNNANINANILYSGNHPAIGVTADTKSKINTVGAVGNVEIATSVAGTAGVAINRMYQDTKAEMATAGGITAVNAGLTQVRAAGDGDIHSVGVGGTVGVNDKVSFAGSGSYNYIGNNVVADIKNQKLTSNSSVGVVAQSDDRLYNFAGGFAIGANTNAAIGSAVAINKITGDTNALVEGGSVAAAGTDKIKVSRADGEKIFKAEALNVSTTRDGLSNSRKDEEKSGIVVDSTATHTLISQMSSGGVAVSSGVSVGIDGTVNINTIKGETAAKIKNADINVGDNASDVNVNAIDYTNLGTFTGTPAISGGTVGVSVGVSADWETLDRTTAAEISSTSGKKKINAKNLTVDAEAKHGSSGLAFAAAAGVGKVGVSSGDSIMRHRNTSTTLAKISNADATFDGAAEVKADHLGNSHSENISASVSAGMIAASLGVGVSVMDDTSTVKAEVENSDIKAKESGDDKNISVLANNENNWKNTLVTAGLAGGIGGSIVANVGINNTTGETAAVVKKSNLEGATVKVAATDKLTATGTGGVGSGGLGGVGVAVILNNINSSVSAQVAGGSITASKNIDVTATEDRSFDKKVTGAVAGGLGVGVNVAVTSINKGITDKDTKLSNTIDENGKKTGTADGGKDTDTYTKDEIKTHVNNVNNMNGALGSTDATKYGYGLTKADRKEAQDTAKNMTVSLDTKTDKQGLHTKVSGNASLTAAGDVNVTAKETNAVYTRSIGVTAGLGGSVNVTDAIIHMNYAADVTLDNARVTGKNVTVEAVEAAATGKNSDNNEKNNAEIKVTAVTAAALGGVGVGYAGIVNNGKTEVNINDSTISAIAPTNTGTDSAATDKANVTINALDETKSKADILNVGVSAANVTTTFASVENKTNVGVALGGKNEISAAQNINIDAKKADKLEAHTQGVGVGGVAVAVNHATIEDEGKVAAKITGTNGTFTAEKFHMGATNDTTGNLSAGNTTVSILGVSRMRGKGVIDMDSEVSVAGGTFNAKTAEFVSMLGNANNRTLEGNVKGHNISVGAVAPDAIILDTAAKSNVNVSNSTFAENTDLVLDNESYVDRKAYIYDVTAGGVAVGNSSADISGTETLTTTLTGKNGVTNKLNSLEVLTYGENTGKAFADAGGGGLVSYIGSHVENKSTNTVNSTIGGKWETAGEVLLVAAQNDETRLTATEGHGGIAGVGGTSVDNIINTTTNATVNNNTEITADRVHIGTGNAITTGAYDDTNSKGEKEVQTFTMKDHFGGVISGNRLRSLVDITENGTVTIGENAKITTNKLQEYIATSENDLTNLVQAKGGGAIAVTDAVSEFDIDVNNKVDVRSGATLSNEKAASTEDIILAAYDNQTIKSQVDGTVYAGVISPIVTKNNIDMNRQSNIDVAGNIDSGSKVGLYAGANKDGILSNLNADFKSGAYNYSIISITTPRVNYKITADKGTVDVGGTVRATGDINVIASGGKEEVVKDQSLWNWALGGSSTNKTFLTSDAVTQEEALPKKSTVNVTGSLIAGTANPIKLTIKGSVANGITVDAPDNDANNRVKNGVTDGVFDYCTSLAARWEELDKLITDYDTKENAAVVAAYIAERDRIQEEMISLGLAEKDNAGKYVFTSNGRPVYYVEIPDIATSGGNINVTANDFTGTGNLRANTAPPVTIENKSDAYLKLNNIIMGEKGGQITYNGINNVIPANTYQGNEKINSINNSLDAKEAARFKEIGGKNNGEDAALLINNTFSGDKTSTITVTPQQKEEMRQEVNKDTTLSEEDKTRLLREINNSANNSFTYTAIPDVEVNGRISNFYGNVTINNQSGDIRINGGTPERPTGVEGDTVKLTAANGSIAQGYKEGIVNINGDPEDYLNDTAVLMKNHIDNAWFSHDDTDVSGQKWADFEYWHQTPAGAVKKNKEASGFYDWNRPQSAMKATGYIAGRDVYVSASNINVNGLIQSGYKNYTATVTEAQLAKAQERPADKSAVVKNRTMYKVNDGGAKWNSTDKVFDYEAQVYWDPSTKQLFVEDIDTAGGKVYLTGKIASTGDGKILAADGAAKITVTNNTSLDMNVGKVLNNQREGVITIADTAKNTWTEYKTGTTRYIDNYTDYLKNNVGESDIYANAEVINNNGLSAGTTLLYKPKDYQLYNWTMGEVEGRETTKQHYVRYGLWGAVKTMDINEVKGDTRNVTTISEQEKTKYGLPTGAVIKQETDNSKSPPYTGNAFNWMRVDANAIVTSSETTNVRSWMEKTGFFGWFRNYYTRWTDKTATTMTYNFSIYASRKISIGFIGDSVGSIDIKSANDNGGSINLTGNIVNSNNAAKLDISSAAGSIKQFENTTLKSEIVNLTAKNDIENIRIASVGDGETDKIQLNALSTNAGDIDITATGGGYLPGNVEIIALKSQIGGAFDKQAALGDVSLTAKGNITQANDTTTVEGRGINLTSRDGNIGTKEQSIKIAGSDLVYATDRHGAQVNAAAQGNIYLTEAAEGGDMRVGKIDAKSGDITLTVENGGFIDALPGNDKSGSNDSVEDMVNRWVDTGLIAGDNNYEGAYIKGLKKNRDDYKAAVEEAYNTDNGGKTKAEWQDEYVKQETAAKEIYASAAYKNYLAEKTKYDALSQEDRQKLIDGKNGAFAAYAKQGEQYSQYAAYETAEDYLKNTAAYKYAQYENAADYLANDDAYKDLVEKAENPTYEWTKDMMLYAVSDKLVNPESGGSVQTERAANILGNNVTLTASEGVGTFADEVTTITVEDLKGDDKINHMKKLMNVDASDVEAKFDEQNKLVALNIQGNMPLGINAGGTLNVTATKNVSLSGRQDEYGENSAVNVGKIDATAAGNVRLYSAAGINNALGDDDGAANIKGKNLLIRGGKESIGAEYKPLTVDLAGDLTDATADKSIYIENINDDFLRLGAMYAGDTIVVESDKGVMMSDANADIADSYINAGNYLTFKTAENSGLVGEKENAIRILNNRAAVDILGAKSAYIKGVDNSSVKNGTLTLGTIKTTGEFIADGEGSIALGQKEAVDGIIKAGGDVILNAADNVILDGEVTVGDDDNKKKLSLTATSGSITQTNKGAITADTVETKNNKSLRLENENNNFNNLTVDGSEKDADISGDVIINDKAAALTVKINPSVAGDIAVKNLGGTLTNDSIIRAKGDISLAAKGNLTQGTEMEIAADKNVTLVSENGDLKTDGDIYTKTGEISLKAKENLTLDDNTKIMATRKNVSLTAENGGIKESKAAFIYAENLAVSSAKSVDLQGQSNEFNAATVESSDKNKPIKGSVSIYDFTNALNLSVKSAVTNDITVETGGNEGTEGKLFVLSDMDAMSDITLKAKGSLQTKGKLTASDVNVTSTNGEMTIGGDVTAESGKISLNADKNVQTNGNLAAMIDVNVTATNGEMTIGGDVTADGGKISLNADKNVQTKGNLAARNDVNVTATNGEMTIGGNVIAERGEISLNAYKNLQTNGKIAAKNDVKITATKGDVSLNGDVTTGENAPEWDEDTFDIKQGSTYNSLTVTAGGAIKEKDGVKIKTPVMITYSGKGVSAESKNNEFAYFLADSVSDTADIDGSVKAVTNYAKGDDDSFIAGIGANIKGDAAFSNLATGGNLDVLIWKSNEDAIKILGGNEAKGSLTLKAAGDITLSSDANAAHDIAVDSDGGAFYGIGRGINADHDVKITAGDAVYYIGTTDKSLHAGNDIRIETKKSSAEGDGIYIGALPKNFDPDKGEMPQSAATEFSAGNNAYFKVSGNGDMELLGDIKAAEGEITADISGKGNIVVGSDEGEARKTMTAKKNVAIKTTEGDITVSKGIMSQEANVSAETGKGNISVGRENKTDGETIRAKNNVTVGTNLGTIYIQGETRTEIGDITMKAGKNTYTPGAKDGNFIIREEGKIDSGGGVNLYGRNGDIHITDDILAKKGITAAITDQGNIYFDRDVRVTDNVSITTDKGDIKIGHTVNADGGAINIAAGTGNILVGKDVTAGKAVNISTGQGNIVIGDKNTGDDGDVLSEKGDVSIKTNKGNIEIIKTVTAKEGSLGISSEQGDILIGNNGPDVKTVTAKANIDLATKNGKVVVYGKTSTEQGDISISARKNSYVPGEDGRSFIIDQNGKLIAGGAIHLDVGNGDLHVSDRIQAKNDLVAELTEKGSVYFDTDVDVEGKVSVKTKDGDINVGHDVRAAQDIAMTAARGNINVGAAVNSSNGDVNLATNKGNINIGEEVRAERGSIGVQIKTGNVTIGDNGPDVETVTAKENIKIDVELGKIMIYGKTSTENGDIALSAGENSYTPGVQNIIIGLNGEVDSGRDINLTGRNGDLHVTDAIKARRNLNAKVNEGGGVFFDRTVNVTGDIKAVTKEGEILIGNNASGRYIELKTEKGNISALGNLSSRTSADVSTEAGDIALFDVTAGNNVNIYNGGGNVLTGSIKAGGNANVDVANGDADIGSITADGNAIVNVNGGNLVGKNITAGGNADIGVTNGDAEMGNVEAKGNAIVNVNGGNLVGKNIMAGGNADIGVTNGDAEMGNVEAKGNAIVNVSGGNLVGENITAGGNADIDVANGNAEMGSVTADGNATVTVNGGNLVGKNITAGGNADIDVANGNAEMGSVTADGNATVNVSDGNLVGENITAGGNADIDVANGDADMGNVTADGNAAVNVSGGNLDLSNMLAGNDAGINVSAGNIAAGDVTAGRNADVSVQNGDIRMHDVTAAKDAAVSNRGNGSINANDIAAGEITHVSLTNGDLFLNLAEGRAVLLQMENNTAASRVNRVVAESSGGAEPDVAMTGNFIQIGFLADKGGESVFELSAKGAGDRKLIGGNFQVDSLSAKNGSHMHDLWANRGRLHVDEGYFAADDVLAVDKVRLDNARTNLSIYGRTPTRDGEQLVYWNNLNLADSKTRFFRLDIDGKVRTRRAVLIDADRNYGKLYGDNLSVVDMMGERLTHTHGKFTFDSTLLTEPGRLMRESVFFDMGGENTGMRQQNASDAEIVVE